MHATPTADVSELLGHTRPAASSMSNPSSWFTTWATGDDGTGVRVNEFTALNYAALFTCVKLIANAIASLPLKVYRKRADGGQDEVSDHPAAGLLQRQFNPNTSSFVGRQAQLGHLLTWGNSYTQIIRRRNGELMELRPIGPDLVTVRTRANGDLYYTVQDRGRLRGPNGDLYSLPNEYTENTERELSREECLHVPFFTFDSLAGMSLVRIAKGVVRQGLGQDRQAERFVTSGMRAPGAMKFREGSKFKSATEAIQFRERFRAIHQKAEGDQEIIILEDGAEWQSLGVDPESAQLLESRRFSRIEIASFYQIPPNMIGESVQTYNGTGVEELNIWFATYCLLPILELHEQEMNRKFFTESEQDLFVKHELKGLLRGDTLRRSQALQVQMQSGIITVNEWRRLEGMNPIEGGDVRYFPLNMGRVDEDGDDVEPPPSAAPATTPGGGEDRETPPANDPPTDPPASARQESPAFAAFRRKMVQDVGRCLRKEAAEAVKAARKPGEFGAWVDEFYGRIDQQVRDVYDTDLTAGYADRHLTRSRGEMLAASECKPTDLVESVTKMVERWHTERIADLIADLITEQAHATV